MRKQWPDLLSPDTMAEMMLCYQDVDEKIASALRVECEKLAEAAQKALAAL